MRRGPGYSVFVSRYGEVRERLRSLAREGSMVFTSLHIAEEFGPDYARKAAELCRDLADAGYSVMADVSKRTLEVFGRRDAVELAAELRLHALRLDYGFTEEETVEIGKRMPLCLNASTLSGEAAGRIARSVSRLYCMHNYYPRPETGLDRESFDRMNRALAAAGAEILAFIPGEGELRGPLHRGLPTLEDHRDAAPYAAFADLSLRHGVAGIFVGDGPIGAEEAARIDRFIESGIIELPVRFSPRHRNLEGRTFTVRPDTPAALLRLQESREYATAGRAIEPENTAERKAGSVTMDNSGYLRYSGEMQVLKRDFPADSNVNVIGKLEERYRLLLDNIAPGGRIRFVPPTEGTP